MLLYNFEIDKTDKNMTRDIVETDGSTKFDIATVPDHRAKNSAGTRAFHSKALTLRDQLIRDTMLPFLKKKYRNDTKKKRC